MIINIDDSKAVVDEGMAWDILKAHEIKRHVVNYLSYKDIIIYYDCNMLDVINNFNDLIYLYEKNIGAPWGICVQVYKNYVVITCYTD
jgi:hypothetical protein